MKKITVMTGLCLALLVPAISLAAPSPNAGDKRAAKSECKTLRGDTAATREAFLTQFRNFGACVSKKAREEAKEGQNAHTNAASECRAARDANPTQFMADWGTSGDRSRSKNQNRSPNGEGKNAFGKCVSATARAKEHKADAKDKQDATEFKNAAKECASERSADPEGFKTLYGTERSNWKNAFGKCVSKKVREDNEHPAETQPTT